MKKTMRQWFCLVMVLMMAFSFTAHAAEEEKTLVEMKMAEPGSIYSDIVAGIDLSSVIVDGDATLFSSVMSNGTVVRFEGTNITVSEDGITLKPDGSVVSLESVGSVYLYRVTFKDGTESPAADQWFDIGYGYTDSPDHLSVERASSVFAAPYAGVQVCVWNDGFTMDMTELEPNFVFFRSAVNNTADVTITSLMIGYNPAQTYTDISVPRQVLPAHFESFEAFFADRHAVPAAENCEELADEAPMVEEEAASGDHANQELLDPMASADVLVTGSDTIYSDLIAGIDHSTIVVNGVCTYFNSVMSDGAVARFEAENITITDEGIVMKTESRLTSLDSVGKIYEYAAKVKNHDTSPIGDQVLNVNYAYTFSAKKTSVTNASEVYSGGISGMSVRHWTSGFTLDVAMYAPNFVSVSAENYNTEDFTLTSLIIAYDPSDKVTAITAAELDASRYGCYVDGEPYDASKENKADADHWEYEFYLMLKPEVQDEAGINDTDRWLHFLPKEFYQVGDLKDANGNVLDKAAARVHAGTVLDVTIGDYDLAVELPMATLYQNAQTLKEARPYSTLSAVGEQYTLVVPVVWADQTSLVSDEVYACYQKALGCMIDEQGNVLDDFSVANDCAFSLSEYFDIASYGQLLISSFMTEWYYTDKIFADDYEFIFPEIDFADEVLQWVKATYPNLDWSKFDQDGDGVVDSIVLISVGQSMQEGYVPASFGGAVHATGNNFGKLAGTPEDPQANCFLTVNHAFLANGDTSTLIHEYSHNFGLNDYYDGSGNGINAVGGYDMEGDSVGDWNAYSKLAVGWMEPQVVTGLAGGEAVELTIGSSALKGDVIVLPAAGTEYTGPFSEYVMIDLLSPDGVNAYDAAKYQLENTVGVRISHVNATMKRMTESDSVAVGYIEDNGHAIGMELYTNNYDAERGFYNLEVIQADKTNTFSNLDMLYPYLRAKDLFYAGDTFTAESYDQFFYQGQMDNGMPLGYTVTILSIDADAEGQPTATIRITAN